MAANEGGALARTVSAMLSAGGEFAGWSACLGWAWAAAERLASYPGRRWMHAVDRRHRDVLHRHLAAFPGWRRSIVSALLTRKDGHSVYAC